MSKALKLVTSKKESGELEVMNLNTAQSTCQYEILDIVGGRAKFTFSFEFERGIFEHPFEKENELPFNETENYLSVKENTTNQISVSLKEITCIVAGTNNASINLSFFLKDGKTPGTLGSKTPGTLPEELGN